MEKQQVWSTSLMSPNQRCMKKKRVPGQLVACVYNHVPGINFSKKYSPTVNDIMFCILLLMVIHFGFLAEILYVNTVFLYGDLEEELYTECPQGMSDKCKDYCII